MLAVRAAMRKFLRQLDVGAMSDHTRQVVTGLGVGGAWHAAWCSPRPAPSS
ncbi:hypothetical protein ACFQ2B_36015 [Streptomyces stramineus]